LYRGVRDRADRARFFISVQAAGDRLLRRLLHGRFFRILPFGRSQI